VQNLRDSAASIGTGCGAIKMMSSGRSSNSGPGQKFAANEHQDAHAVIAQLAADQTMRAGQ